MADTGARTAAANATPETVGLTFGNATADVSDVPQLVFGELITRAFPAVTAYHSDFYHDARWLAEWCKGTEFTFYYTWDGNGTVIGTDAGFVIGARRGPCYRVTVKADGGSTVTFTPIPAG